MYKKTDNFQTNIYKEFRKISTAFAKSPFYSLCHLAVGLVLTAHSRIYFISDYFLRLCIIQTPSILSGFSYCSYNIVMNVLRNIYISTKILVMKCKYNIFSLSSVLFMHKNQNSQFSKSSISSKLKINFLFFHEFMNQQFLYHRNVIQQSSSTIVVKLTPQNNPQMPPTYNMINQNSKYDHFRSS